MKTYYIPEVRVCFLKNLLVVCKKKKKKMK